VINSSASTDLGLKEHLNGTRELEGLIMSVSGITDERYGIYFNDLPVYSPEGSITNPSESMGLVILKLASREATTIHTEE